MKINTQKIELLAAKRGMTVTELAQAMEMTNQNFNTIRRRGSCKGNYRCTHCPRPAL